MNDPELRTALSQSGRIYVEQQHDWRVVTNRLVNFYQQVISSRRGKSPSDYARSHASS
jgi:glycosyltransferase involved in cell wall biosynthesis